MHQKEKCQLQADQATVGILNDSETLLALEPEYVNPDWIMEGIKKLELVHKRAMEAHVVRMYQITEEVRNVYF